MPTAALAAAAEGTDAASAQLLANLPVTLYLTTQAGLCFAWRNAGPQSSDGDIWHYASIVHIQLNPAWRLSWLRLAGIDNDYSSIGIHLDGLTGGSSRTAAD